MIAIYLMEGFDNFLSFDEGDCIGQWTPANPAAIEQRAALTLPSSATNLFADSVAWQDCLVFVNFDMAAADLETFLASTNVIELDRVTGASLTSFANLAHDDLDWTFDDAATYLSGQSWDENTSTAQSIVIANPDSDIYTVYIITILS